MRARTGRGGEPDGILRPYWRVAAAALVFGLLCVLVELQSSSLILWAGERVQGTNDGGIVYYTVNGDERTLDLPGEPPPTPVPLTVYADPDDSSHDRIWEPVKWFDAVFVLLPFVAAGTALGLGVARRRRYHRWLRTDERRRRAEATRAWRRR